MNLEERLLEMQPIYQEYRKRYEEDRADKETMRQFLLSLNQEEISKKDLIVILCLALDIKYNPNYSLSLLVEFIKNKYLIDIAAEGLTLTSTKSVEAWYNPFTKEMRAYKPFNPFVEEDICIFVKDFTNFAAEENWYELCYG